jgi:uncharacterized SAM-binding protein YcdF (DUF218 family)
MEIWRWMWRVLFTSAICALLALPALAQVAEKLDPKSLEAAVALSQTLTQWAFLIMGGSVVILVGTSYYRPPDRFTRGSYFLFVPGWTLLASSIYHGIMVQRANLGFLFFPNLDVAGFRRTINRDAYGQIESMEWGLAIFGLWLLIYLCWWIFRAGAQTSATR